MFLWVLMFLFGFELTLYGHEKRNRQFEQMIFDGAINQWCDRLRACVRIDGGHFEHMM